MPYSVRCKACSTTFAIPDEIWEKRVKGRIATLKCRSCKAEIEVDGKKPSVSQFPSTPPSAPTNPIPPDAKQSAPTPAKQSALTPAEPSKAAPRIGATVELASATRAASPPVGGSAAGAAKATPSPTPAAGTAKATPATLPDPKSSSVPQMPAAKSAQDLAAADTGWSLVPPPSELARVGLGSPLAQPEAPTSAKEKSFAATEQKQTANARVTDTKPQTSEKAAAVTSAAKATATAIAPKTAEMTSAEVTSTKAAVPTASASSSARGEPSSALAAARTPTPTAVSSPQAPTQTSPVATSPVAQAEPEPDLDDLWVVSYGDDDDRELTENQIASELAAGKITLATIVWHEGMPEWLPISGVPVLSKYAPTPKPSPARQAKPQPRTATSPASSLTPKLPTAATGANKAPATTPRSATTSTQKAESPAAPRAAEPKVVPVTPSEPEASAPVAESKGKQPPPLPKSTSAATPTARDSNLVDDDVTVIYRPNLKSTGGRPPALPRRERPQSAATSPWESAQAADEVVTSAPRVGTIEQPPPEPPATDTAAAHPAVPAFPAPKASAAAGRVEAAGLARAAAPSIRPTSTKTSRPPKPVETATSTVMRTEASPNVNNQLISDEEFLAMQRRLPKWAIPAAAGGALVLIGLLIWAFSSGEDLPPIPVAPVPSAAPTPSIGETPSEPSKRPQAAVPASSANTATPTAAGDEKDFARLFAQSVAKATGRFDAKAAERIAVPAMESASRCRHAPEPAGQSRSVVTFATSGQVLSVQVGAPYINSPTGKCIETALSAIKLPPFQGQPGRLTLTVVVR